MTPSSVGQPLPMALAAIKRHSASRHPFPLAFPLHFRVKEQQKKQNKDDSACHQSCEFYRPDVWAACGF